eukprot:TRINITY_DN3483_c0_g1_i1.p1 TRINITY_DN3483_c0_g1~~TRINITY_DN3483_c0_g1_i1.p1  ORF type:complete len:566 (+),score=167.06 TRINITY_DN3483_c0_g1_i1:161-1858(+)
MAALFDFSFAFNDADHSNRVLTFYFTRPDGRRGSETVYVNTAILAGASDFFKEYYSEDFVESADVTEWVDSKGVEVEDRDAMVLLLKTIYAGGTLSDHVRDDVEMLLRLMRLGHQFYVGPIIDACSLSLKANAMTLRKAVDILLLPRAKHDSEQLQGLLDISRSFIETRFADLDSVIATPSSGFFTLPLEAVRLLLSSSKVKVQSEDTVFFLVLEWARRNFEDFQERLSALQQLWPLVRFSQMTGDCLLGAKDIPEASASIDAAAVNEALHIKLMHAKAVQLIYGPSERYTPRPGRRTGAANLVWIVAQQDVNRLEDRGVLESSRVFLHGNWYCIELQRTIGRAGEEMQSREGLAGGDAEQEGIEAASFANGSHAHSSLSSFGADELGRSLSASEGSSISGGGSGGAEQQQQSSRFSSLMFGPSSSFGSSVTLKAMKNAAARVSSFEFGVASARHTQKHQPPSGSAFVSVDRVQIRLASKECGPSKGFCPSLQQERAVEVGVTFRTPAGVAAMSSQNKLIYFRGDNESHGLLELAWDHPEVGGTTRIFDESGSTTVTVALEPLFT